MADLGSSSPSSAFASANIKMYFTEAVQSVSTATVSLQGSNGGSYCSSAGACTAATCSSACGYTAGSPTKFISSLALADNVVTATVPTLQAGKGYKLYVE